MISRGNTRATHDLDVANLTDHLDVVVMVCDVEDAWLRTKVSLVSNAQIIP